MQPAYLIIIIAIAVVVLGVYAVKRTRHKDFWYDGFYLQWPYPPTGKRQSRKIIKYDPNTHIVTVQGRETSLPEGEIFLLKESWLSKMKNRFGRT